MKVKKGQYITNIAIALATGIIGTLLVISNYSGLFETGTKIENVSKVEISENSIADAVDKVFDAVVVVVAYKDETKVSTGTGFIYKQKDGKSLILTNNHVVENGNNVKVIMSNEKVIEATVVGKEAFSDIAVLSINETKDIKVATLGDSTKMKLGDTVFAVGSPLGVEYSGTVTKGILSGKDRIVEVSLSGTTSDWLMRTLQTDAAINPGNSGGPLSNINGEVIGINSLKLVEEKIEGMGFAIPIEDAIYYADILEKGEKIERPYLGVTMYDLTELYSGYNLGFTIDPSITSGVVIGEVESGSPADKAGLKKGDVVTEINNVKTSSKARLRYELYKNGPGDTIAIKYIRGKDEKTTTAKVSKVPSE